MRRILPLAILLALFSCTDKGPENNTVPAEKPDIRGTMVCEDAGALVARTVPGGAPVKLSQGWKMARPSAPALSPDGKTLVFQGMEKGKWQLYSYELTTGEEPELLVEGSAPSFSADGKRLAFSKNGQLAIMNMETKTVRALTFEADAPYQQASFSPDGTALLYSFMQGNRIQIGRMDIESMSSQTLFRNPDVGHSSPVYYSEGKFCFVSRDGGNYSICSASDGSSSFKTVFKGADCPAPAIPGWIVFSKAGSLCLGHPESGAEYPLEISGDASAFSSAVVSIAEPVNSGPVTPENGDDTSSDQQQPVLKGRMVYHSYSSYNARDSRMFVYDFSTGENTEISRGWTALVNPMNGHFSPDGKLITFMAEGSDTGSWDIYLYDVTTGAQPVNLTPSGSYRDEDPKFSFDGRKIVFKREDHLAEIGVEGGSVRILTPDQSDLSMPFYSTDGNKVVFGGGNGTNSYIGLLDLTTSRITRLYDRTGVVEYYPVTIDATSFYYTAHVSADDNHDQLFKGFFDGSNCIAMAFNNARADYSDACPVSGGWLIFCSTRSGSQGGYDLYIGHEISGVIYSLNNYSSTINSSLNELGASYCAVR